MENSKPKPPPSYSIDEALNLYLSMLYPGGLPEGEESDKIISALREKIIAERPEWAEASGIQTEKAPPQNYAELKEQIAKEAIKEEVPEDPEERYYYERRKEARENREKKVAEEREAAKEEEIRRRLIEQNRNDSRETIERALLIRKALEKRAAEVLKNRHEGSLSHDSLNSSSIAPSAASLTQKIKAPNVSPATLAQQTNLGSGFSGHDSMSFTANHSTGSNFSHTKSDGSLQQSETSVEKFFQKKEEEFFKSSTKLHERSPGPEAVISKKRSAKKSDNLSVDQKEIQMNLSQKIDYLQRYNENRRAMMKTKEEAISMSGSDERFSMEMGLARAGKESSMELGSSYGDSRGRSKSAGGLKL